MPFNCLIANVKLEKHQLSLIIDAIHKFTRLLKNYQKNKNNIIFEEHLQTELTRFNTLYFPSPEFKRKIANKEIDEHKYAKEKEFITTFFELVNKYNIKITQNKNQSFLDKWFLEPVRKEIDFLSQEIKKIDNKDVKNVLSIILSRTVRSCRATTHTDLATLKKPVTTTYYCKKHRKICKPVFSISKWWEFYTKDTLNRLIEFDKLRTNTFQICLTGDSRTIDIYKEINKINKHFGELLLKQ